MTYEDYCEGNYCLEELLEAADMEDYEPSQDAWDHEDDICRDDD